MLIIPKEPNVLRLPIGRLWNGERCHDSRLSALVELQAAEGDVTVSVVTPRLSGNRVSESPVGTRLDEMDALDRLCIFFIEDGGQYLEIKLGIGGQYSVQGFDAPHEKVADFTETKFFIKHELVAGEKVKNKILISQEFFPTHLVALNAFFVVGNQVLAYHPLSGDEPDLHQINTFPLAKLEE